MKKMTPEESAQLRRMFHDWIKAACGEGMKCPACGREGSNVAQPILYLTLTTPPQFQPQTEEGDVFPFLPLVCTKCGHARMFSVLALYDAQKQKETPT
jgi:hypothetical protein